MSESATTAPASAPAPAPAPASTPAPAPGTGISVSDAARLLGQQRRTQPPPTNGQTPPAPQASGTPPPPAAPSAGDGQPPPVAAEGPDTLAQALGMPDAAAQMATLPPPEQTIDLGGQRYTHAQLAEAVRQSTDYTKKTQTLAEQARQLQAQQEALATALPLLQPEIARLQQSLTEVPRPDRSLIESNLPEYLRQHAAYEHALEEQQRLGQLTQLQQQAQARAMAEQVARANEILTQKYPQWGDEKIRQQWQQDIRTWARDTAGFTEVELSRLTDPRQLETMMKALMYDRLRAGTKTKAPAMTAPPPRGVAPPPAAPAAIAEAQSAFDAKPSLRSGVSLLNARRGVGR